MGAVHAALCIGEYATRQEAQCIEVRRTVMKSEGEPTVQATPASDRIRELRSDIRDLGYEIDSRKAAIAAAMGGGVFLLLLAAGAFYDLVSGNTSIWNIVGASRNVIWLVAGLLAAAGAGLLALGVVRHRLRDAK